MKLLDTIAAISTPYGKGGVALLRVSGADALTIAERVFRPKNGKPLSAAVPRTAVLGDILSLADDGEVIDEGLATVFLAPASFTGEPTVEIACHGGILLTETVLTSLLRAGARLAEAGEFTRRAFLNGKLGLSAAEALGNVLDAGTHEQLLLAQNGMRGRLSAHCRTLYERLTSLLASVYVKIDYPDEDLADLTGEEILAGLRESLCDVRALAATYRTGHAIAEGIPTVICGVPNVGKSSLYNRLVGRDAAIVTSIEGTTRDVLTETASLGRVTLRLYDTAGIRETENPVEQIGIDRARAVLAEAELVLAVFDGSRAPDAEAEAIADLLHDVRGHAVAVLNKGDLWKGEVDAFYSAHFADVVVLSAKTGDGMDDLSACVERLFVDGSIRTAEDAILTNARQHAAAMAAAEALECAVEALSAGGPIDAACMGAEQALASLGEIDGRAVSEDIVTQIFSRFCVGK